MIIVLDVSAAVDILLQKGETSSFASQFSEAAWVIAPDLYVSELSNVFWKFYRGKTLNRADCMQYIEDGIGMVDDYFDGKDLWKEAVSEAMSNDHPVYDMYYAVLARRHDAMLLTSDRVLTEICRRLKIEVCGSFQCS